MPYDTNNIFARILRGEIPCSKVYEDDYALAFNDIHPQAPVHILIIPKGAYLSMSDFSQNATSQEISGFFRAVGEIVRKLGIAENGYRTISNAGLNGGQEVPHFHMHILAGRVLGPMLAKQAA